MPSCLKERSCLSFKFSLNLLLPGGILLVEEVDLALKVTFNLGIFAFLIFVTLLECLDLVFKVLSFSLYCVSLSSQAFQLSGLVSLELLELGAVSCSFLSVGLRKLVKSVLFLALL